eukprot:COSAG01_NODE_5903_length_3962_cov_9.509973_4_plen_52_part_00
MNKSLNKAKLEEEMNRCREYMRTKHVPPDLRRRVRVYLEVCMHVRPTDSIC